jgi:3-hydroxyacyl-CoA dehydrogenase
MRETEVGTARETPSSSAVVGAGTMGFGEAGYFVAAGVRVYLSDATPGLVRQAPQRLVQRHKGTKSGRGFFTYSAEESKRFLLERDRRYAALSELLLHCRLSDEKGARD